MCNRQKGKTAMGIAVQKGHKDIIEVLKTDQSKLKCILYDGCAIRAFSTILCNWQERLNMYMLYICACLIKCGNVIKYVAYENKRLTYHITTTKILFISANGVM